MTCRWCGVTFPTPAGYPRYDLLWVAGRLAFICLGGCR